MTRCLRCGSEFEPRARDLKRGRGKFCSQLCQRLTNARNARPMIRFGASNPSWKGGISQQKSRYTKRYAKRYPLQARAMRLLHYAVSTGKLTRPTLCERCGQTSPEKLHGHHADYTQPLQVQWVCRPCHRAIHGQFLRGAA